MIYEFNDGQFEFFTAKLATRVTTFRVRVDTWPEVRAREKNIPYDYIRKSSEFEINNWVNIHPDYPILEHILKLEHNERNP